MRLMNLSLKSKSDHWSVRYGCASVWPGFDRPLFQRSASCLASGAHRWIRSRSNAGQTDALLYLTDQWLDLDFND